MFNTPFALFQFSKLPDNAQAAVLQNIPRGSDEERGVYEMYRRKASAKARASLVLEVRRLSSDDRVG